MFSYKFSSYNDIKSLDYAFHSLSCDKHPNFTSNYTNPDVDGTSRYGTYWVSKMDGFCWRRLDNRVNSLYGSTYEVPMSDYDVNDDEFIFWIYGDCHLMSSKTYSCVLKIIPPEYQSVSLRDRVSTKDGDVLDLNTTPTSFAYIASNQLDVETLTELEENQSKSLLGFNSNHTYVQSIYTLYDILHKVYPNSSFVTWGDFTEFGAPLVPTVNVLYRLYDDLQLSSNFPDYIIVNGIEASCIIDGIVYTKNLISSIIEFCFYNDIKLCFVTDAFFHYDQLYGIIRSDVISIIPDNILIDIDYWIFNTRNDTWNFYYNDTIIEFDILSGHICNIYPDFVYNYIIDRAIDKLGLYVYREKYYVSLVYQKIEDNTYSSFISSPVDYKHGPGVDVYTQIEKTPDPKIVVSPNPLIIRHHLGKYGTDQSPNLFMNNGEFMAVVVHTGYSDVLYANQQFQANTNFEYLCQTDTNAQSWSDTTLINTLLVRHYLTGAVLSEESGVHYAMYPSTGAPWFVISAKNRQDYAYKWEGETDRVLFDFYISFPDTMSCTLTIKTRGHHEHLDNWQSISFGVMDHVKSHQYAFPLYCGGGSIGISNDIYKFVRITGGPPTYYEGNSYDLDFNNICFSNSNILHPTLFNGAHTSNFKVLSIEGEWKNIYAHSQQTEVIPWPTAGPPPDYATVLRPITDINGNDNCVYPCCFSDSNIMSTKYLWNHGYNNISGDNYYNNQEVYNSNFIPVIIFFNMDKYHNESFSGCTIPGAFCSYDQDIGCGEYIAEDGSVYLVIPCGWEGRLYNYGHHFGIFNEEWEACDVVKNYEDTTTIENGNVIRDRLVIKLRDGDV